MNTIESQFYDVMHKYRIHFTPKGVGENLKLWRENKADLVELLRRHPNWNEEELAVVSDIRELREVDSDVIYTQEMNLRNMMAEISPDEQYTFSRVLQYALSGHDVTLSEHHVRGIKDILPDIRCAVGQKTSRAVNRICRHFHVDRHERYNSVFAQMADALNPIEVERKAVLSVHPCDFLEMSNENNNWSSCHGLRDGCHCGGTLSYLNDGTSLIFYTVDGDAEAVNLYSHPKRTRQMFYFLDVKLLQSRLYPSERKEQMDLYRHVVQEILTACLGEDDKWTLVTKGDTDHHYTSNPYSHHYRDYKDYGTLSLLKGKNHTKSAIMIGHPGYCTCCGERLTRAGKLNCGCSHDAVCHDCGETVNEPHYYENVWLCSDCLQTCACCHTKVRGELLTVVGRDGEELHLCRHCMDQAFAACQSCSVSSICDSLDTRRFCTRVTIGGAEMDEAA